MCGIGSSHFVKRVFIYLTKRKKRSRVVVESFLTVNAEYLSFPHIPARTTVTSTLVFKSVFTLIQTPSNSSVAVAHLMPSADGTSYSSVSSSSFPEVTHASYD